MVLIFGGIQCVVADDNFGLVVVAKYDADGDSLSKKDLRPIFMGGNLSRKFNAIHLPAGHPLRLNFNTKIIGLTEARIQSYWAQLKFTGRGKPPIELESVEDILEYIKTHENVAAYLPEDTPIPEGLIIIYP